MKINIPPIKNRLLLIKWAKYMATLTTKDALLELDKFPRKELAAFINNTPVQ
jgi:hypothetical protein